MSYEFENLRFKRIILHNVYPPNSEGAVSPKLSEELTELDSAGLRKLQERITKVLGSGSHCLEMEIANDTEGNCFQIAAELMSLDDSDAFIRKSGSIAQLHTNAHTNRRWPGGALVVIKATVGPARSNALIIIKAERQEGFVEKNQQESDSVIMEYVENLLLTPQTKLYKVGVFVEMEAGVNDDLRDPSEFKSFVFDSNISAKDDRKAAKYFYSNFLGLRIPENAEQRTRDFYEHTSTFIKSSDLPTHEKVDLHNALYTYLKTDQSEIIQVDSFAESYFPNEMRDDFVEYMEEKSFPTTAIAKDLSLLKTKLRHRKMSFSSAIKITGPSDNFSELVEVLESTPEFTKLKVSGALVDQN